MAEQTKRQKRRYITQKAEATLGQSLANLYSAQMDVERLTVARASRFFSLGIAAEATRSATY
jgi:hypothetical protein